MRVLLSTILFSAAHLALASNVLDLNSKTFDDHVGAGHPPSLVEFFAPWCGHCKSLAPAYEQLGDAFAHAKDKVQIVKVDADGEGRDVGQKYGVTGFPTLKWFPGDGSDPKPYEGARDLEALVSFVETNSGVKSKLPAPPPVATRRLTIRDFDEVVMDAKNDVLVAFTAPWCGHCKSLKPTFNSVASAFIPETNCIIADFDADNKGNAEISTRYGIQSYPTIKYFPKGDDKTPIDYQGARSEADFVAFLNSKCGTQRAVGGGLNNIAGRLPEFDSLASSFFVASASDRPAIQTRAADLAKSAEYVGEKEAASAKYYLRVMEKIAAKSEEWLEKESNRLAGILGKKQLGQVKLDDLRIKSNIMAAFKEAKKEEKAETVDEAAEKLHEEL